jgi:hypothetical protein
MPEGVLQAIVATILAMGRGEDVPLERVEAAGHFWCKDAPEDRRVRIPIGEYTIWCNNQPPFEL